MATFNVVSSGDGFHCIDVQFADQTFRQNIYIAKEGDELRQAMQEYADNYERDWTEANPPQASE